MLIVDPDNFLSWQHGATIKNENKIYSACDDGKVSFISANDIARMGFFLLTDSKPLEKSYRLLGPEAMTFDQVAETLSRGLGHTIEHVKISEQEVYERFVKFGMSDYISRFLAGIEAGTAHGGENFSGQDIERVTGKAPESFEAWIKDNKDGFAN
jgi:festuclavine dehydrogenase